MKIFIIVSALLVAASALPRLTIPFESLQYKTNYRQPQKFVQGMVSGRVIGGHEAQPNSLPFEAYLGLQAGDGGWLCGGALLTQNYVITAGHCVEEVTGGEVILGMHRVDVQESTQAKYGVQSIVLHEGFSEDADGFDIGLIVLDRTVTLTPAIQTIKLPTRAEAANTFEGASVIIAGWGATAGTGAGSAASLVLMETESTVISLAKCEQQYGTLDDAICSSGEQNQGACYGDSGAPLIYNRDTIIGIVSSGMPYCVPGYPTIFTSVTKYLDWIEQNSDAIIY